VALEEQLAARGVAFEARPAGEIDPVATTRNAVPALALDARKLSDIRAVSERLTAFWSALSATDDPARRAEIIERYGAQVPRDAMEFAALMRELPWR
jgi:hypothetical protein